MSNEGTTPVLETAVPRSHLGRSIWAIVAGFIVVVVLSNGTDVLLSKLGIVPPLAQWHADRLFVWATIYRIVYGIIGSYITARLAPQRPMKHAMIGAIIGMVLGTAAAIGTWNKDMGPHWYPIALVVVAVPTAWIGAKLLEIQRQGTGN
jgi:hypothetical protein